MWTNGYTERAESISRKVKQHTRTHPQIHTHTIARANERCRSARPLGSKYIATRTVSIPTAQRAATAGDDDDGT